MIKETGGKKDFEVEKNKERILHQMQEFGIDEYDKHIVLGIFLSRGIENVEIPDALEGKTVTVIGDNCFFNCVDIKTVSFP